jgi:hypothetical protein
VVVSGVGDLTEGAIRLEQGVFTLHNISITFLVLGLVVSGVGVFHGVRVSVFGMSLKILIMSS